MTAARAGMAARPRHQLLTWLGATPAYAEHRYPGGLRPARRQKRRVWAGSYGWAKPKSREFPSDCDHFAACHAFVRHGNHLLPCLTTPATPLAMITSHPAGFPPRTGSIRHAA